ncbi:EAL domain-containing protein [Tropicimonas sp. S265A]|uniref:EAL domain-containing protein n=1 Tax=Tropicimonas sp. S265A TaxID=3415134 RepID=UPI003C7E1F23
MPPIHRNKGRKPGNKTPLNEAVAQRDRNTMKMVANAVARKNVLLAYQPVMMTRKRGRPAFYEGLIRVMDNRGRIIPAREFIETVENQELGRQLDCLALEIGLDTLRRVPGLRLAINMSARSIGYEPWSKTLRDGLAADPTAAERLILEITEQSAMIMPEIVTVFMKELQRQGISFALDDFGAGYTSFRYLRDFYFDILKIDGQFVRNIAHSADNQVLVQALVDVARHFDMFTVAESVETADDVAFLTAAGVDCLQGYHFAAPSTRPGWLEKADLRKTA